MAEQLVGRGTAWIIDVTDRDFEREVLARSRTTPVVVDFWAPWCGPCRTLGPILERLADEHKGAFVLARVNIDENPGVAGALGIQSIPFVIAFRDGRVASEFVGAQPEPQVRQFVAALVPPSGDPALRHAAAKRAAGDLPGAEAALRAALAKQPDDPQANLMLAQVLADAGHADEALRALDAAVFEGPAAAEADRLRASLRLAAGTSADAAALEARIAADPGDLAARLDLGRLHAAAKRYEEALAAFLEVVRRNPAFDDGAARKAMLDVFSILGRDHPIADRYQRELSRLLFR